MRKPFLWVVVSCAVAACRQVPDDCEAPGAKCWVADAGQDAGTDAGVPDDGGTRYVGHVAIATLERANELHIATAAFEDRAAQGPVASCTAASEHAGACCFHLPPGSTQPPVTFSAGMLSFTVLGAEVAKLEPMMGGYFSYQWGPPTPPAAGDRVKVTATGERVGTFSIEAVQPAAFEQLDPPWSGPSALDVDRSKDLTFTWRPGSAGDRVHLLMSGQSSGTDHTDRGVIECEVDDSAGSLTVAASLFSHFQAGDLCNVCGLNRTSRTDVSTDNADVSFELVRYGGGLANFR